MDSGSVGSVSTGQDDQERRSKSSLAALDGAAAVEEHEPMVERVLAAVFATFATATSSPTCGKALYYVLRVFGLLQLLLFALPPDATWLPATSLSGPSAASTAAAAAAAAVLGGGASGLSALGNAATIVPSFQGFLLSVTFTPWPPQPGGAGPIFPLLTLWALSACFVFVLLAGFVFEAVRAFDGGKKEHQQQPFRSHRRSAQWLTVSLQLGIIISVLALSVPLIGNLLAPLVCAVDTAGVAEWGGLQCWATGHIVVFSFSLVLVTLFAGFLLVAAALFQSRSPDHKAHPTAVAHGRVEAAAMAVQLVLTVLFVAGGSISPWVRVLINLAGAIALLVLYVSFLPYYDQSLNRFQTMLYATFVASCVAQLLSVSLSSTASAAFASAVGGLLWAFLMPLSAYVGYNLADASWRALARSKELSSTFQAEMRLRFLLAEALRTEQAQSAGQPGQGSSSAMADSVQEAISRNNANLGGGPGGGLGGGGGGSTAGYGMGYGGVVAASSASASALGFYQSSFFNGPTQRGSSFVGAGVLAASTNSVDTTDGVVVNVNESQLSNTLSNVSAGAVPTATAAACPMGFAGPTPPGHGTAAALSQPSSPELAEVGGGTSSSTMRLLASDDGLVPAAAARIPTPHNSPPYGVYGAGLENVASGLTVPACRAVMQLLSDSLETFPNSPIMRLFAAHYLRAMQGNVYLERSHLRAAERLADTSSLDVRFFSLVRQRRLHEEDSRAATGHMTVETRLYFDWLQEQAAHKMTTCRSLILSFWTLLCDRMPDLRALQNKGAAIFAATRETEAVFKELLDMVPTSVPVMRAYAEFLLDVSNNPTLANELMTDADQLEDESSKTLTTRHDVEEFRFGAIVPFDMGADGIGLLKVNAKAKATASGDARAASDTLSSGLGTVTYANNLCLKVLGYTGSRREILGKDMNALVPAPINAVHARYLSGFVASGLQRISGSSRVNYVTHRLGYLVPIREHVQATGDEWLVALEEIPAPHMSILWVHNRDGALRITAACRRAFAAFGLSVPSLRAGTVTLQSFLADAAGTLRMVLMNPGAVVQLRGLVKGGVMRSSSFTGGAPGTAAKSAPQELDLASREPEGAGTSAATGARAAGSASGYFTAHAQELTVPYVAGPIYIIKLFPATSAEVRSAVTAGRIPPPARNAGGDRYSDARSLLRKKATAQDSDSNDSMSAADSDDQVNGSDDDGGDNAALVEAEEALGLGPSDSDRRASRSDVSASVSRSDVSGDDDGPHHVPSKGGAPKKGALKRAPIPVAKQITAGEPQKPRVKLGRGLAARVVANAKAEHAERKARRGVVFDDKSAGKGLQAGEEEGPQLGDESSKAKLQAGALQQHHKAFRDKLERLVLSEAKLEKHGAPQTGGHPAALAALLAAHGSARGSTRGAPTGSAHVHAGSQAARFRSGASVASGGSEKAGGSSGSMLSPAEMIRRGVKARSRVLEASLIKLRRSLLAVFAIVCATNVASFVVTQVLTTQLLTNLGSLRKNSQRAVLVQRTASVVQLLVAHGDTSLGFPLYDLVEGYSWARERMRSCITDVETLHTALYIEAEGSGNAEWLQTYVEPIWPVLDLSPDTYVDRDNYVATQRNVSLADIVIEFAMRVHSIWWYNANDFNASDGNIFWVEQNAPFALMSALNASLFFSSSTSAGITATVQFANIIVLAVALSVFLLVTALVIVPSVAEVLKEQREVFDVFSKVPVKVMRHLRDALAERISQLQRAASGEDDIAGGGGEGAADAAPQSDGIERDVVEAGAGAQLDDSKSERSFGAGISSARFRGAGILAAMHSLHARASKRTQSQEADDKKLEPPTAWSRLTYGLQVVAIFFGCLNCLRPKTDPNQTGSQRHLLASPLRSFSRASSGFAQLVLRMVWPVLAFTAYYIGMFVQASNSATAAAYSRAAVLWSVELEVLAPTVGYNMRNTLFYLETEWTRTFTDKLDDSISVMASISESIAYGDASRGLQSLVSTSPGTHALLMVNGCVDNSVDAAECALYGAQPYYGCNYYYQYSLCSLGTGNTNISTPAFFFGVIGTGLYPGMLEFFLTGKNFVAVRRLAFALGPGAVIYYDANHYTPTSVALHPGGFMNEMANSFLAGGLADLSATIYGEATTAIAATQEADLLAVIFSNLALVVFYFGLYLPLIGFLDGEIKRTRFLLLLVPEEVAKGVPAVVAAGRKLAEGTGV